ncbi:MAG: hypothetical protein E7056_06835 [Lentisphaerae bacterium]|nr:hypothetical protein [Lentisphaerota bacterium]
MVFKNAVTAIMLLISVFTVAAMENLLPKSNVSVDNSEKYWHAERNAACTVKFSTDPQKNTFRMVTTTQGYANYRYWLTLPPGEYTIDLLADGRCDTEAIGTETYSFDAAGNPQMISMERYPAGILRGQRMVKHFTVPAGSVRQRFGLSINNIGSVEFTEPAIYKGKWSVDQLPPRSGVQAAKKSAKAARNQWAAEWIWVKDLSNIYNASIVKEITLKSPVEAALVQVTGDNGYKLYVNRQLVGGDGDWQDVELWDISSYLKQGKNRIELAGENHDGKGGIILQGQIWCKDGSTVELLSDATWDLYIDKVKRNDQREMLGKVPVNPWGKIPFKQMTPPEVIRVPVSRYINNVKQGEIFTIDFNDPQGLIPEKDLKELTFTFYDSKQRPVALSAYVKPHVRKLNKTVYVDLVISPWAMPGKYTWKLEGMNCAIAPEGKVQTITVQQGAEVIGEPGCKYGRYDGTNRMTTPTGTQFPFNYATFTPCVDSFLKWPQTGGNVYEIVLPSGVYRQDGSIDISTAEQTMMQILAGNPNAGIYIRLRVDVPGWWASKYPNETFRTSRGGAGSQQSYCSRVWVDMIKQSMKTVMDTIAARPVGKALSGMLIMGFRGGEFQLWGEDVGEYDCSAPAKKAFTLWQKKNNYTDIMQLPHPALEWPFKKQAGYGELRERFFRFTAEQHADNLIEFAKFFKDTYGEKYDFGIYFGYAMEHGGSFMRMLYGGHLGFERVMNCGYVDLLSSPASYGLRPLDRSHGFMNAPTSAAMHGIRSILENDIRNYRNPQDADSSGMTIASMRDSLANDSRLMLLAATQGAIVRYLALAQGADWFIGPEVLAQIAANNREYQDLLPAEIGAAGQVVLAIDPMSWTKAADSGFEEKKWGHMVSYTRDTLMRSGRSVAFCVLNDVLSAPERWSVLVIPAPSLISAEKRAELEAAYGKFPALKADTGAIVIVDSKIYTAETREEIWKLIATEEARAAGYDTIWYVGKNFIASWKDKTLNLRKLD